MIFFKIRTFKTTRHMYVYFEMFTKSSWFNLITIANFLLYLIFDLMKYRLNLNLKCFFLFFKHDVLWIGCKMSNFKAGVFWISICNLNFAFLKRHHIYNCFQCTPKTKVSFVLLSFNGKNSIWLEIFCGKIIWNVPVT